MPGLVSETSVKMVMPGVQPVESYHRYSDTELVKRCLAGEEPAWAALVERYEGLIYSIALKFRLSREDAADVFQSVWLALLQDLGKLNDATKLSSWLSTVTRRQCFRRRERARRYLVDSDHLEQELANKPDESLVPDQLLEQLEQERLLEQAVSMLDAPCRQLVQALFYDDQESSYEKLAEQMGLAPSTIGPKRGRCLKRIRRILDELNF
ncbi:MAG: sigma-70 family RNA polymerase sigma factor [Acidobacteriota bacterium]|nr:RNA polymerase sigma factor [Blastocatellia bacterium]MDW8241290.1 sigma-70 family RNA polymerase sigma factor [Acidobacteriota bacterium]